MKNKSSELGTAIKNVVLVHGAFADGSGFKALYKVLTKKGYRVTIVQNPLTSLEDDVAATKVVLDNQDGPVVLAGHSWGGAVITEAGNHPNVEALVYIAAFQPDTGESALQWLQTAAPAPENGVLPPDEKGIVYYDEAKYHASSHERRTNKGGGCYDSFRTPYFGFQNFRFALQLRPSNETIKEESSSIQWIELRKISS